MTPRMRKHTPTPLGRAVIEQVRILADLFARWGIEQARLDDGDKFASAAAWSRRGTLVILANGHHADNIAYELERAGLIVPQRDKPEHIEAA